MRMRFQVLSRQNFLVGAEQSGAHNDLPAQGDVESKVRTKSRSTLPVVLYEYFQPLRSRHHRHHHHHRTMRACHCAF